MYATADTLFDDHDSPPGPDPRLRRAARRKVLAGALRLLRTTRGWNANDAAAHANIAPMTWRRLEDGLVVRRRSLAAVDQLLGLPLGGTERALSDDLLMLDLVGRAGVDVSTVPGEDVAEFLDRLAERFATGTVHARSGGATAVAVGGGGPAVVTVAELLRRLAAEENRTPTMGEAVDVLSRLLPELYESDRR